MDLERMTEDERDSLARRPEVPACGYSSRRGPEFELREKLRRELAPDADVLAALARDALSALEEGGQAFALALLREAKIVSARVHALVVQCL